MPDAILAEAEALLRDPHLAQRVCADIETAGVVGERKLALTVYFVGVSAQLEKPLAAINQGASSSGKSYVIARVASLTPNALYYFPAGTLRRRRRAVAGGTRTNTPRRPARCGRCSNRGACRRRCRSRRATNW